MTKSRKIWQFSNSSTVVAVTGAAMAMLSSGLGAGAVSAASVRGAEVIDIDTRLGQRVLHEGKTQRVYLRIGIKGRSTHREKERTPVNVALVIDRSGSMQGHKIIKARDAAKMAIDRLAFFF